MVAMKPEHIEALQRLSAALGEYLEDRETSVPDEPVIPERIDPGHPVHNAVVEVQKHCGGQLPIAGGAWEAWRWLLWYSRAKGHEGPFEQANKAYHFADELQKWAEGNGEPESRTIALVPEEKTILEALADESAMTVTQEELAGQTRLSDKTVRKYLNELRKRGFVNQPRGPKKGFVVTSAGLTAIGRK